MPTKTSMQRPSPSSTFSSGVQPHQINDKLERSLIAGELALASHGKRWRVTLISGMVFGGVGRIVFGSLEAIGAVFFAIIKGGQAFVKVWTDRGAALLAAKEGLRALTYVGHGLGNIVEGLTNLVFLGVPTMFAADDDRYKYATEETLEPKALPAEVHPDDYEGPGGLNALAACFFGFEEEAELPPEETDPLALAGMESDYREETTAPFKPFHEPSSFPGKGFTIFSSAGVK